MNVYCKEMKASVKSLVFWSIGILLMIYSSMAKYEAMGATDKSINSVMNALPKAIRAIFGVGDFDLTKASGFYGLIFLYLAIMGGIHAGLLGANLIAKEERDKVAEFLYTKPASRKNIISAKLLAGLTNIVIFNIVTLILSIIIANSCSNGEKINNYIVLLMLGLLMIQLFFFSIGALFGGIGHRPKSAGTYTMILLMTMYFISVIIDMTNKLNILKFLTVFKYYDAARIMKDNSLNIWFVILTIIVIGLCGWFTYNKFTTRDLQSH